MREIEKSISKVTIHFHDDDRGVLVRDEAFPLSSASLLTPTRSPEQNAQSLPLNQLGSSNNNSSSPIPHSTAVSPAPVLLDDPKRGARNFMIISIVYLAFTITDTSFRVAVLLYCNTLGFSAFQIAILFSTYEIGGIATNFLGGVLASKFGLKKIMIAGLFFQLISIALLIPFRNADKFEIFSYQGRIAYITFAQSFSGIAKDMIKISGKSASKGAAKKGPNGDGESSQLFKLVAAITGAKNAIKGLGFFVGTFFLQFTGFMATLIILFVFICFIIPPTIIYVDPSVGKSKSKKVDWKKILLKSKEFNFLCLARLFLFGSRDVWFEVTLPIFFRNILGWQSIAVGSFMAGWVILYGFIQGKTDRILHEIFKIKLVTTRHAWPFKLGLFIVNLSMAITLSLAERTIRTSTAIIITGLVCNGFIFAINSSIHSYFVVELSDHDKTSIDVGFYYMSNAVGRLTGTMLGGVLYSFYSNNDNPYDAEARTVGFAASMWGSVTFVFIATMFSLLFLKGEKDTTGGAPVNSPSKTTLVN